MSFTRSYVDYATGEAAAFLMIGFGLGWATTPWATVAFGLFYFMLPYLDVRRRVRRLWWRVKR